MKAKRPPMVDKMKARLKNNPKVNLTNMELPLTNGKETPKLKDILEENVDEKFYLREEVVEKIIKEDKFQERLATIRKTNVES